MTRTTQHSIPSRFVLSFCALLLSTSATLADACIGTGVRNSTGAHRLNEPQLQQVQASLRHKSGFVELRFDEQGALTLGNRQHVQDGSATARALLIAAVESANLYELESHERAPDIAFAQIHESVHRLSRATGKRTSIYQVQLDFADFKWLTGAPQAKAAFEIGLVLLHELAHGVLQLRDPPGERDQIGDCDAHINQIRRELHLPERAYYYPDMTAAQTSAGSRTVYARLVFVERTVANTKPSAAYSLTWLSSQVSPNARNVAELERGLVSVSHR
jgi:hypothetical protein